MKCSLGISNSLEEIFSFSYSIVFLYFFALIAEGRLSYLFVILWNSAIKWVYLSFSPLLFASILLTAICKASSDSHFAFLYFFFFRMVLIPVFCTMSWTFIHSSSGTLSIRSSPLNLFLTSTRPKWSSAFLHFLQFQSELGNKEFMIWTTIRSHFCWLYRVSPSFTANNIINLILVPII